MSRISDFAFSAVPTIKARRSKFDLRQDIKTTGSVGTLYPFYCQEVYPGDSFKLRCTTVSRVSSAFVKPVMDNLFIDQYFFFVPSRIIYERWAEVFGENKQSAWAQTAPVDVPACGLSSTQEYPITKAVTTRSVAGYLGLPVGQTISDDVISEISVLPFRAFAKIYDEWFRDENNIDPMNIIMGSTGQNEHFNDRPWSPVNYFGQCPKIAKYHDYFTSSLPAPQKGDAVNFALGSVPASVSPVAGVPAAPDSPTAVQLAGANYGSGAPLRSIVQGAFPDYLPQTGAGLSGRVQFSSNVSRQLNPNEGLVGLSTGLSVKSDGNVDPATNIFLSDLFAFNKEQELGSVTVNDLRLAFQTQKMLEKDARYGSRYTSFIEGHFGVKSPDARLQRPEFLGGKRTPMSIFQVAQTSQSSADNPLGTLSAFSHSVGVSRFTKGFVEHGYVIGVMAVRYHHTYSQGVERFWTRRHRLDFYDPVFANIGEQPVYKRELFAGAGFNEVFGYNEAWADLRYRPSRVSGEMSPNAVQSLDVYHFADEYTNAPTLSEAFINETPAFVDRTLAVPSETADQFVFDILIENDAIRELPVYSVPSLIDHH